MKKRVNPITSAPNSIISDGEKESFKQESSHTATPSLTTLIFNAALNTFNARDVTTGDVIRHNTRFYGVLLLFLYGVNFRVPNTMFTRATQTELFCCGKIYKTRLICLETYDNFGFKIQNAVCMC